MGTVECNEFLFMNKCTSNILLKTVHISAFVIVRLLISKLTLPFSVISYFSHLMFHKGSQCTLTNIDLGIYCKPRGPEQRKEE